MGNEFLNHPPRRCARLFMFSEACSHFRNYLAAGEEKKNKQRINVVVCHWFLAIDLIKYSWAEFAWAIWAKYFPCYFGRMQSIWLFFHCYVVQSEAMQRNSMRARTRTLSFSLSFSNVIIYFMCAVCNWVCTHYYVNYVAFDLLGRFIRSTCGDCVYCWCGFFTFHWCNTMQNPNAIVGLNTEPIATSVPNVQWKSIKYFYWEFIYFFLLSFFCFVFHFVFLPWNFHRRSFE